MNRFLARLCGFDVRLERPRFDFAYNLADYFYAMKQGKVIVDIPKFDAHREELLKHMSV
jgi:ABC-type branched-subunit amino acid transport system ATPase component